MFQDYQDWVAPKGKGKSHRPKGGKGGTFGKGNAWPKGKGRGPAGEHWKGQGGKRGQSRGAFAGKGHPQEAVSSNSPAVAGCLSSTSSTTTTATTTTTTPPVRRAFGAPTFAEERRIILQMATVCTPPIGEPNHWSYEAPAHQDLDRELQIASREIVNDREVALICSRAQGNLLCHFSDTLRDDKEVVRAALLQDKLSLCFASEALQGNKEFVLECVRSCGFALEYASPELQADQDVVLAAAMNEAIALEDASPDLMGDKNFVLKVLRHRRPALAYASEELQDNREVVLVAVRSFGSELRHASGRLQADREVVLIAVNNAPDALRHASPELRADREVVLTAVRKNGRTLEFAGDDLKSDRLLVLEAVKHNAKAIRFASPDLKADKDFLMLAARTCRNPAVCYGEVQAPLRTIVTWDHFLEAYGCALAVPGEQAPILSVVLAQKDDLYEAQANLLSGTTYSCEVLDGSSEPILKTLAQQLLRELPRHAQIDDLKHIFMTFLDGNGDNFPATIWDWDRPLSDFLQCRISASTSIVSVSATNSICPTSG